MSSSCYSETIPYGPDEVVKREEDMEGQGYPFSYCEKSWLNEFIEADFEIKDGVLIKYNGTSTDVCIPNSVTTIGEFAFDEIEGRQHSE